MRRRRSAQELFYARAQLLLLLRSVPYALCLVVCCQIGLDLFRCIMNDKRWDGLPIVLETPCKTEAKEVAKRKKKAVAAGEALDEKDGGDEEEEEADEDDEGDEGDGGKKKGKGRGKGQEKGMAKPKEKEDWVKSYSDEIDMLYGLEEGKRAAAVANGVKKEEAMLQVKHENQKPIKKEGKDEDTAAKELGEVTMKNEMVTEEPAVMVKKEKQKMATKRGRKGKITKAEANDDEASGVEE